MSSRVFPNESFITNSFKDIFKQYSQVVFYQIYHLSIEGRYLFRCLIYLQKLPYVTEFNQALFMSFPETTNQVFNFWNFQKDMLLGRLNVQQYRKKMVTINMKSRVALYAY